MRKSIEKAIANSHMEPVATQFKNNQIKIGSSTNSNGVTSSIGKINIFGIQDQSSIDILRR